MTGMKKSSIHRWLGLTTEASCRPSVGSEISGGELFRAALNHTVQRIFGRILQEFKAQYCWQRDTSFPSALKRLPQRTWYVAFITAFQQRPVMLGCFIVGETSRQTGTLDVTRFKDIYVIKE